MNRKKDKDEKIYFEYYKNNLDLDTSKIDELYDYIKREHTVHIHTYTSDLIRDAESHYIAYKNIKESSQLTFYDELTNYDSNIDYLIRSSERKIDQDDYYKAVKNILEENNEKNINSQQQKHYIRTRNYYSKLRDIHSSRSKNKFFKSNQLQRKIEIAPGSSLLRLSRNVFGKKAADKVFEPLLAEAHEEYFLAINNGKAKLALWMKIRIYLLFLLEILVYVCSSTFFKIISKLSK